MEWTDNFSTGVTVIDEQHRQFISIINSLVKAVKEQACKYIIKDVIRFLEKYSAVHFDKEEERMRFCRYPEYLLHKAQHDNFAANVIELKKEALDPDPGRGCASYELSVEANRVMVEWALGHIANEDKKLGAFLNETCPDCVHICHAGHLVYEPA